MSRRSYRRKRDRALRALIHAGTAGRVAWMEAGAYGWRVAPASGFALIPGVGWVPRARFNYGQPLPRFNRVLLGDHYHLARGRNYLKAKALP